MLLSYIATMCGVNMVYFFMMNTQLDLLRDYLIQEMIQDYLILSYHGTIYTRTEEIEPILTFFNIPYQVLAQQQSINIYSRAVEEIKELINIFNNTRTSTSIQYTTHRLLSVFCHSPKVQDALQDLTHPFTEWFRDTFYDKASQVIISSPHESGDNSIYWIAQAFKRPLKIQSIFQENHIAEWMTLYPYIAECYPESAALEPQPLSLVIGTLLLYGFWPSEEDVQLLTMACEHLSLDSIPTLTPLLLDMTMNAIPSSYSEVPLHL